MSKPFEDAVVVWLDPNRPDFGVTLINDVPSGLSALHRYGIDEALQSTEAPLWHNAAGALVHADIEPSPTNIQKAYDALLRLVKCTAPVPSCIRLRVSPRGLREHVEAFFGLTREELTN
jgi:hypothetical protein